MADKAIQEQFGSALISAFAEFARCDIESADDLEAQCWPMKAR
jgi:hypothetical protein